MSTAIVQNNVMSANIPQIERVKWSDIRHEVLQVNPEIVECIDTLQPGDDMPLCVVSYPYGYQIDDGEFYWPTNSGASALLTDPRLPKYIKNEFLYAGTSIPAGIVLQNNVELFIDTDAHIITSKVFKPGNIFALWGHLDPDQSYQPSPLIQMAAGTRSIIMVPSISDSVRCIKLKTHFKIKSALPKTLRDQWQLFSTIVNSAKVESNWRVKMLLFSDKWIKRLLHEKRTQPLYTYLIEYAWIHSAYWRSKIYYDYIFSSIQKNCNLKPNPYLLDTVKHLISIAAGAMPGFCVAVNEDAAPVKAIQDVYVNNYGLKYAPTILHPDYFSWRNPKTKPVYYSVQYPGTLEFSPRSRELTNTTYELCQIKDILTESIAEINKGRLKINHGIIAEIVNTTEFDFFHSKPDINGDLRSTHLMPLEDPLLIWSAIDNASKEFATTGPFVRGCIRISRKNR